MKYIVISVSFILLIFACKKNPFDYRSKYYGDYDFTVHQVSYSLPTAYFLDTTYYYTGKIKKGKERKTIIIEYSPSISKTAILNKDGTLECNDCVSKTGFSGNLNQKIKLNLNRGEVALREGAHM